MYNIEHMVKTLRNGDIKTNRAQTSKTQLVTLSVQPKASLRPTLWQTVWTPLLSICSMHKVHSYALYDKQATHRQLLRIRAHLSDAYKISEAFYRNQVCVAPA